MSNWPSAKAKKVLAALQSIGWRVKRQSGSRKTLEHADYPDYVFAFMMETKLAPGCFRVLPRIPEFNQVICDAGSKSANNAIHLLPFKEHKANRGRTL